MTFTEVPGGTQVVWTTRDGLPVPFGDALARPVVARVFDRILDAASTALTGRPGHSA